VISGDGGVEQMTRPSKTENATKRTDARRLHPHLSRPDVPLVRHVQGNDIMHGMAAWRAYVPAHRRRAAPIFLFFLPSGVLVQKKKMESRAGSGVLSNGEANENVREICTCASTGDGSEIVKGLTAG
jgi:hypothetical protein